MRAGVGALRGWLVCRVRRKEDATRRHPPAADRRRRGRSAPSASSIDVVTRSPKTECQELRRERQPVGLASQRQRLDPSEREERQHVAPARSHVVRPVQRADVIDQTLLEPASVRRTPRTESLLPSTRRRAPRRSRSGGARSRARGRSARTSGRHSPRASDTCPRGRWHW